jgi:hypothetical protein
VRNVRKHLGAGPASGSAQVLVFVPSADRYGKPIDQERWKIETLRIFGVLFRGATAFPPGEGVWRDDERDGELVFDRTVMVVSYVSPRALSDAVLRELGRFLRRMGRETNQGEVGVLIAGTYHPITQFEEPT